MPIKMHESSKKIKLIVFDVDGTLINDDQMISEKTIAVIHRLQNQGIHVSFATGKIFPSIENLLKLLEIKVPIILSNGAIIQQPNREIIFSKFLCTSVIEEITQSSHNFESDLALFTPENIYVEKETFNTDHIKCIFKEKIEVIGKWSAVKHHFSNVCKAIWINRLNIPMIGQLTEHLIKTHDGRVTLSTGTHDSIEAMPVGVSKQTGLINLVEYLHIPMDSVMVFGDQLNDYGMMEVAGIGVAVGNAIDSIKTISDYVIRTNNDEGPAKFLSEFFTL